MNNMFKIPIVAAWIVNSPASASLLSQLREYVLRRLSHARLSFEDINTILDELLPFNRTPSFDECLDTVDWYMYGEMFGVEFLHQVINLRQLLRNQISKDAGMREHPDLWYFQVFKDNFLILEPKATESFTIAEQEALEERIYG